MAYQQIISTPAASEMAAKCLDCEMDCFAGDFLNCAKEAGVQPRDSIRFTRDVMNVQFVPETPTFTQPSKGEVMVHIEHAHRSAVAREGVPYGADVINHFGSTILNCFAKSTQLGYLA